MTRRARTIAAAVALLAVATLGMALRVAHLAHPPLSVDEAESAINALTILQRGYPADTYLSLPLFENTLTRPWPQHPEYEFRDTSYSDKGMAIYHGWLPLYAIAASFTCAGVEPDVLSDPPRVRHGLDEMRLRTVAARVPSVLFGAAFIAVAYGAARDMGGAAAGAVALVVASLAEPCVRVAREARYYSAALLIATLCCWAVWAIYRRGRWREFVLTGVAVALTFHTHVLTFAVACAALGLTAPWWLRRRGAWSRFRVMVAIVAVATVPWALATGFIASSAQIPAARTLLVMPDDLLAYVREHLPLVALALVAAVALVVVAGPAARALPARLTAPLAEHRPAIALTLVWLLLGAAMFILLVPASSAFFWRMTLPVQGPVIVLGAVLAVAAAAVVVPRHTRWVALLVAAAFFARPRELLANFRSPPPLQGEPLVDAIEHLRGLNIDRRTKLYAVPLQHFPLMLYSGLPIQNVAPVRRSFLDEYGGDVIVIDSAPRRVPVSRRTIAAAAVEMGSPISDDDARQWERRLEMRILREDLSTSVARLEPALEQLPPFATEAVHRTRASEPKRHGDGRWQNPAVFRGFECYHKADFWPIFFYRFVDPVARRGRHLNYASRARGATATVLPEGWVVYHSPGAAASTSAGQGGDSDGGSVGIR